MVSLFGGGASCTPDQLEMLLQKMRELKAKEDYLKSLDSVNPQEYERMKAEIEREKASVANEIVACIRTFPKKPDEILKFYGL